MHCPSCGFENPEGLKFCNECGTPLLVRCAQCGFTNQPQAKFCGECGAALSLPVRALTAPPLASRPQTPLTHTPGHLAEKILTSKAALEGERKQVTVLFADLKGSLELILADRDPEEARQLMDPVLECMMAAVHRHEGTVNQVMGDGIMALFGAPIAHEDHAVRACYAALAMQEAVKHYAAEVQRTHSVSLQMRVGVNAGEVVVRAISNDLHIALKARPGRSARWPTRTIIHPRWGRSPKGFTVAFGIDAPCRKGAKAPSNMILPSAGSSCVGTAGRTGRCGW
jgi:hypothetical protein